MGPFALSVAGHFAFVGLLLFFPYLLPRPSPIRVGSGAGGGIGGEVYSVGVADDLGGGAGLFKPSLTPQPPALPVPKPARAEPDPKAVPVPDTVEPKKAPGRARENKAAKAKEQETESQRNVVPTAAQPGAGGTGGVAGGSGGGRGGGLGVSIGTGSGGFGDSWYVQAVEKRISSNWSRPAPGIRIEIVYSFVIYSDGTIREIRREKSSGNEALDLAAERAIRASTPLAPPPPEYRGRPLQFVAQFVYPPIP